VSSRSRPCSDSHNVHSSKLGEMAEGPGVIASWGNAPRNRPSVGNGAPVAQTTPLMQQVPLAPGWRGESVNRQFSGDRRWAWRTG
jgi:hypothetical protein